MNWKGYERNFSGVIEVLSQHLARGLRKTKKNHVRIGVPGNIRTRYPPNMNLKRYHYAAPFGLMTVNDWRGGKTAVGDEDNSNNNVTC
jgi:hypothetical protein